MKYHLSELHKFIAKLANGRVYL